MREELAMNKVKDVAKLYVLADRYARAEEGRKYPGEDAGLETDSTDDVWQSGFCAPLFAWFFIWIDFEIWSFWIFSYRLKHLGTLGFHPGASFLSLTIIPSLILPKIIFGIFFFNEKYSFSSPKP